MPGFITHLILGDQATHFIEDKGILNLIETNRKAFNLGLEGPDIFFLLYPCLFVL